MRPAPTKSVRSAKIAGRNGTGGIATTYANIGAAIPACNDASFVDAVTYEKAFAEARRVLDGGELLCIFPEDGITRDGTLQPFKGGIMKILETLPVPVVPIALHNLWGSSFSRVEGVRVAGLLAV